MRRPDADFQERVEGLLWPRADARGVHDAARQAVSAEGDLGPWQRRLQLDGPLLRQRHEPGRAGRGLQVAHSRQPIAIAGLASAFAVTGADLQVIVVAILFALLGVVLGLMSPLTIPIVYARYTAVALLAALDSIFGAVKAYIAGTFEPRVFFSGLLTNTILAAGLAYFGHKLGMEPDIAAIVAFGARVFNNLGGIRRHYL